jgi:[protein-PII] uridylyltransferase
MAGTAAWEAEAAEGLLGRSDSVDQIIAQTALTHFSSGLAVPFSIAAVGGYGRRELFPYSDIDILILVENEAAMAALKNPLSEFLRELWDAGLRASQSVRTVAECCELHEQNIELHISLLDLRFVCGGKAIFERLSAALPDFFRKQESRLIRELAGMARQRHAKFNHTVYHLEPNVKEAPGGIRDIHLLHWLALLAQEKGAIGEALAEIESAKQFLHAVRCFLHRQAKRDNNLLNFESQDQAAAAWQIANPAEWMRLYYRNARRVFQSALRALEFADLKDPSLLRQFRSWRGRLSTSDYTVSHERLFLRNPASTMSSSTALLDLFTFVARHGIVLSWDVQRRLTGEAGRLHGMLREQPIPWSAWRNFFSQPNVAVALRQMQETGLLVPAIPHWQAVECLVVRDFYHRYTVDEHSIVAVEVIDQLAANKPGSPARFYGLLQEQEDLAVLRLALLLHDIGKGTLPGNHVTGSLEASEAVFKWLSVPAPRQEIIRFLIGHHLDLSLVMNGRDLDDPATARFLSSRIPTQEHLRQLALLTYADISAVNPTAMTPWRVEQLWRVYAAGLQQLTRELIANRIQENESAVFGPETSPELTQFLEGFPTRYLRTQTRQQIEHHFQLDRKRQNDGLAVEIGPDSGAYLLTVLTADHAGIFAALCGALASRGMNILKAEASSNARGCLLTLIRFSDPMRNLELNPDEIGRLEWTVECVLRGSLLVADLLKNRRAAPRPSTGSKILPSVHFNNDASDSCTLVDFVGEDRPGLLYSLTSALAQAGCNIELLLVDTEAHKAIDVFYVTKLGEKLDPPAQEKLLEELVRVTTPA